MHAIISHRSKGAPFTIEGAILRVADALDMARGRSRVPFEAGHTNIHSLSAYAIEKVSISAGEEKAVRIEIEMSNSAGIFQVDEGWARSCAARRWSVTSRSSRASRPSTSSGSSRSFACSSAVS